MSVVITNGFKKQLIAIIVVVMLDILLSGVSATLTSTTVPAESKGSTDTDQEQKGNAEETRCFQTEYLN